MRPEEFLIALFSKLRKTCEINKISPTFSYISTPSYLNSGERKALKACAEAANLHNITLIDDWEGFSV